MSSKKRGTRGSMSFRRSGRSMRSFSRPHKVRTAKNTAQNRYVSLKKSKMDYKQMKSDIENNIKLMENAQKVGNLEVYTYSNKLIIVLLLQLFSHGTKKSIDMANYYKDKTGIEIDKKYVTKHLNKLPTLKNTVNKIYEAHNNPPPGSMAVGWRW